ncbi:MAG: ECF transporter S component [Clostridiales bacterium]|nr:ECF transporter S component [Clostridiales bacterium]
MRNDKTRELVLLALFAAIILLMAFTNLGYIPLGVINATIIHIPVIIGALFLGPKKGAMLGFLFGLTSFINNTYKAATASAFVFSPVLAYDLVGWTGIPRSIYICFVPRILVGVVPYFVFVFVKWLLKNENKIGKIAVNAIAGVIIGFAIRAYLVRRFDSINSTAGTVIGVVVALALFAVLYFITYKKTSATVSYIYAGLTGAFTNTLLVMSGIYILYKNAYAHKIEKAPDEVMDVIMGVVTFNGIVEAVVAAIIVVAVGTALTHVVPTYDVKLALEKKNASSEK